MEESADVKARFEEKAAKFASHHLKRFKEDLALLHAALDKNPHKEEYFASLTLYLPIATLHARESAFESVASLSQAFLDLTRQIEKHKDKLTREKRRRER
jgi:ribosome-associated translation inhibitor RaiA